MRKLFRAIALVQADAASMKTHRVEVQRGQAFALRFRLERRWILEIASGAVIVGMVSFVAAHWPASTRVAPQQGVFASIDNSKFLFRLSGSNTIGPVLVPELVRTWLVSVGASGVQETQRVGPDGNKIPEWLIRSRLNGNLIVVEVKGHGSATAFRGMAEGDADIGMTSREMNSAEVAQLMNDFVRFALSVEDQNRKARFAPPSGEDPELLNNPTTIALQRDSLKPAITEKGAKRNIPLAPTTPDSARPPAAAIVPEVAAKLTKTPPVAAVVPEVASELTKPPPPVLTVVPEVGSKALPLVAAVVPEAATDLTKAPTTIVASLSPPPPAPAASPKVVKQSPAPPLHIAPLAITSHSVTVTDYPLLSIRLQEQGTVLIKYLVKEDGSVGDCTVTTPSGKSLLDAAACAMVKGRWRFKPATQDGKPVAEFLTAEVVFTLADLPKEPRPTILASLSPPAPTAPPPVVKQTPAAPLHIAPLAITNHNVTVTDYPQLSVRLREQGTVLIKYLVKEDGSVGDCTVTTPSGKSLLDAAACAMVKGRWKFKPATQDGKPVAEFLTAEVIFALADLPMEPPLITLPDFLRF